MMGVELLLEIGTEEIPASYLEGGLLGFQTLLEACLRENRISVAGRINTYGTPRRLVVVASGIAEKQEDAVREVTGPPRTTAYGPDGTPTKAALGFARRQGVSVEQLDIRSTEKGEYVYLKRNIPGRPTREVLGESLPGIISRIQWPKSMRWGDVGFPFARPIHWVLALLGGQVIPFEVAGVQSGETTRGHRFMAPDEIPVSGVSDYFEKMKRAFVLVDQQDRREKVEEVVWEAAARVHGKAMEDPELVATVTNLVEYPSAVCGEFDPSFLALPDPVLISAMKEHQKYFAVYDNGGGLMPNFVAVNNTIAKDESVVRKGHERVLRARLSDADFFFKEDRKRSLEERLEDLKGVIYQAALGTSYAKVMRFTRLTEFIGKKVLTTRQLDYARMAAKVCKCDLSTHMVTEFPTLQGIMGREYARIEGYPEEVCLAIHEHYLPAKADGPLPSSDIGAVVGVSDRMDTIVGCFAVGLEPTGTADPFALRRHALGILRILEQTGWDLSLKELIGEALSILRREVTFQQEEVSQRVLGFFRDRYRFRMLRQGYESEVIEAVISVDFDRVNRLSAHIEQLKRFSSESKEFHELIFTFKRIANILKKQDTNYEVAPDLFKEECERSLWRMYRALEVEVRQCLTEGDYFGALSRMGQLRRPVDELFEGVEILSRDDPKVRQNRLGMLQHLARLFLEVADFSKCSA